jgi:hypothetical protein
VKDYSVRPTRRRQPRLGDSILLSRMWIYAAALLAILALRFLPGIWPTVHAPAPKPHAPQTLTISGLDLAPNLIPPLVNEYHRLYPWVQPSLTPGGTRQALEDLLNRKCDLAVLSRTPTAEERSLIRSIGDSVETFSIAVGGIAVVSALRGGVDSVSTANLRSWIRGDARPQAAPPKRIYAPDPNLGLWESLTSDLEVPPESTHGVEWLADEKILVRSGSRAPWPFRQSWRNPASSSFRFVETRPLAPRFRIGDKLPVAITLSSTIFTSRCSRARNRRHRAS